MLFTPLATGRKLPAMRIWALLRRSFRIGLFGLCVALPTAVFSNVYAQQGTFLSPDQAFRFSATAQGPKTLRLTFDIAKGYYLYQERFHFTPQTPGVTLGPPAFPPAHKKFDPNLGHVVAHYRTQVVIPLPVVAGPGAFKLGVTYQGCSDQGLCYPPIDKVVDVNLQGFGGSGTVAVEGQTSAPSQGGLLGGLLGKVEHAATGASAPSAVSVSAPPPQSHPISPSSAPPGGGSSPALAGGGESSRIGTALASGRLMSIVPMFLLGGLLLAFTPCILPMIPILSSIIVGHGAKVSRGRGVALAVAYSLGMALVYTAFGVAAGLLGQGLAASLQNPKVLSAFAALLVLLSLSMFGFYELQLPNRLQSKLSSTSGKLQGGHFLGVFVMGGLSALIVGPCVAAPLAGALLYISQTGNAFVGGTALFSLAMGMSVPLLAVGFGAGALLPRAGAWMDGVKHFFGVLLLATALYMIGPVLPSWVLMLAWAALFIVSATFLRAFDRLPDDASGWTRLFKGFGVVLAIAGAVLLVGLASGSRNVLQPLQGLGRGAVAGSQTTQVKFRRIQTAAELDRIVAQDPRPVMLDFYADWCVSCKEMEHFTFTDPAVARQLGRLTLLQVDVTANTAEDKALLKRFNLFGPPGIIFFRGGREVGSVVGFEDAKTFSASLERAGV